MDTIEKVQNDCRRATFLIEKKLVGKITLAEEFQLRVHLAGCSICRTFQMQSKMINEVARAILKTPARQAQLDEDFKSQMRRKIEEKLSDE